MDAKQIKSNRPLIISTAIFIVAVVFAVTLGLVITGCETNNYSTDDHEYKTDISSVKSVLNTKNKLYTKTLVNKKNPVGETYVPENLIDVDTDYTLYGTGVKLDENVAKAAIALLEEMKADGIEDCFITSGYRDYAYQQKLFDNYMYAEFESDKTLTEEQRKQKVLEYCAAPGSSEHQTGLCVDFMTTSMSDLVNYASESQKGGRVGFAETEAFEWLKENAHKFGFILRYPEDKTETTGYAYESWHYRFVGVDAATKMYKSGETLEEWLD